MTYKDEASYGFSPPCSENFTENLIASWLLRFYYLLLQGTLQHTLHHKLHHTLQPTHYIIHWNTHPIAHTATHIQHTLQHTFSTWYFEEKLKVPGRYFSKISFIGIVYGNLSCVLGCIYKCMCIHMHLPCTYTYVYSYVYMCIDHVHTHVRIHMYTYALYQRTLETDMCMHISVYICVQMYLPSTHTCAYTYANIFIHMYYTRGLWKTKSLCVCTLSRRRSCSAQ